MALVALALVLIPFAALAQDATAPLLDPSVLPPIFPVWIERILSYATVAGAALVAVANLLGHVLARIRAAGKTPPAWLEFTVGIMLDVGTDLAAMRERIAKPGPR